MRYIVIDCHFLCHRAKNSYCDKADIGNQSEIIFGFLKQVMDFADKFKTNKFIFCWDSVESKRKGIFPGYKVKPKKEVEKEDFDFNTKCFSQFDKLRDEILPLIGFTNNFQQKGYEADDIVAQIVSSYEAEFIVITRDNDFMQLLSWCDIFDPISNKYTTSTSFFDETGINCQRWAAVKSIAGCKGDTVPGIVGVGVTNAIKYLDGNLKSSSKKYQLIMQNPETVELTRKLVTLPFPGTEVPILLEDEFNFDNFYSMCNRLCVDQLLDRRSMSWWRNFLGEGIGYDNKPCSAERQSYL